MSVFRYQISTMQLESLMPSGPCRYPLVWSTQRQRQVHPLCPSVFACCWDSWCYCSDRLMIVGLKFPRVLQHPPPNRVGGSDWDDFEEVFLLRWSSASETVPVAHPGDCLHGRTGIVLSHFYALLQHFLNDTCPSNLVLFWGPQAKAITPENMSTNQNYAQKLILCRYWQFCHREPQSIE